MAGRQLRGRGVALVFALAVAVGAAGCTGDDGPGADQARLDVQGVAVVTAPDGTVRTETGQSDVDFGSTVVMDSGTARLELASGAEYELRTEPSPSDIEVASPPTLRSGDLLISGGFPASARVDLATISAQGAIQISSDEPMARSYAGRARLTGVGALTEVVGLHQVLITPSATPTPVIFEPTDSWDRRYLGEAAAFGERLEALSRGYTGDLQPAPERSVAFFEAVLPALADEREFGADLINPDRPIGETLVGASIAMEGENGTFRERWAQIFAFRDEGASWGIVALSQGVSSAPLLDAIEFAIGTSPMSDDPIPTTTTQPPTPTTRDPRFPTTVPGPGTTPTTAPSNPTTPTTEPPADGLLTPLLLPVSQILSGILSILGLG